MEDLSDGSDPSKGATEMFAYGNNTFERNRQSRPRLDLRAKNAAKTWCFSRATRAPVA